MRSVTLAVLSGALLLLAVPALAGEPDDKQEKPVTNKDVTAKDVVTTPATDLGIKKNEIPLLLIDAQERPYSLRGLGTCQQIAAAINELNGVLGDDVDLPQTEGGRVKPGRVAQSVVGSIIPFRGVVREISGANEHDRQMQAAIVAGVARRSFLKGIGQGKGCRYPARSATIDVYNQRMDRLEGREGRPREADATPPRQQRSDQRGATDARFISQPVVQRTN